MRPLQDKFEDLENLLLHHRGTLAQNTGVPFVRLVYRPEEEVDCLRRRKALEGVLQRDGIAVETVSCRGTIFAHYEPRGRLDQLFALEGSAGDRLSASIATHARQSLTRQLLAAAKQLNGDGVILLVDVAFLYPYLHLAPVLDDCTNQITAPLALVIFYPGEVDVEGRLLFLGVRPSDYYRARDLI